MVDDAAKEAGVEDRDGFGKYIEKEKALGKGGSQNFTYEEFLELAEFFKAEGGH